MGNLLGAPVTEKETHIGVVPSEEDMTYGVSSMQGWRVHMEDAHICEPKLYAVLADSEEDVDGEGGAGDDAGASADDGSKKRKSMTTGTRLEVPGHSLFAVFDGHGGTFAAKYAGKNFCRVLAHQPKFGEYAKWEKEKRTNPPPTSDQEKAQVHRRGLDLLECALRDAFVECDKEIIYAIRGTPHPDANQKYYTEESPPAQKDGGGEEGNTSAADAVMAAAQEAAKDHVDALDDDGDSGTTAVVVIVTKDWIVCANAGDSRSVYSKNGNKAVPLSYDHKPDDEEEERRIRAAGGYVAGGRVEGDLAVSRGLGDFRFKSLATVCAGAHSNTSSKTSNGDSAKKEAEDSKDEPSTARVTMSPGDQKVSSVPDIIVQTRNPEQDEFIIVACDGIWDVQSNHDCVIAVNAMFQEGESNLGLICEEVSISRPKENINSEGRPLDDTDDHFWKDHCYFLILRYF
jgi:serine/threonine protein phosphatase PrpC